MKRLLILTTLAMFATSVSGCGWWRGWHRGDPCASTAAYGQGMGGYESSYPPPSSGGPHLLPGPVQVLPPG